MEFTSAQVAANKTAMGTLAELVMDKTSGIEQQGAAQLQAIQVESEQHLMDVKLALERLEFRLRHQARDCQALTEQVERHQELLQAMRAQLGQTQLLVERQQEHAKTFVETVEYSVSSSEAKAADAAADCAQKLEAFQQRMVDYVKKLDGDTQGAVLCTITTETTASSRSSLVQNP
jgi:flagellar biosynthesis chaperone FliJ